MVSAGIAKDRRVLIRQETSADHEVIRELVVLTEVASLSPLAVSPESQRNGVGSALVRAVTAAADERGEPLVLLEGSPLYYGWLGFEDARKHGIEFKLPSWAPPDAGQVLRLAGYDRALRGRVVYPPAFDAASQHD